MKKIVCVLIILSISVLVFSQTTNQNRFNNLMQQNNKEDAMILLKQWQTDNPRDIELHICYFNYYLNTGSITDVVLGKMPDGRYGQYPKNYTKDPEYTLALKSLNTALEIDPNRIDVYIGKMQFLEMNEKYSELVDCISNMLKRIDVNGNNWKFKNGIKLVESGRNAEQVIVNAINNVISPIRDNVDLLEIGYSISIMENKYFPKNVIALNHLGSYLIDKGNTQEGINVLLKAYDIDPTDEIIIINVGLAYSKIGKNEDAIKYFTKVINSDDQQISSFANSQINKLKGKK